MASALKKHHDIAIGNILGSNIFNLLAVLAVPGLIAPGGFAAEVFNRDYWFMLAISLVLFAALFIQGKRNAKLGRYLGTFFVVSYARERRPIANLDAGGTSPASGEELSPSPTALLRGNAAAPERGAAAAPVAARGRSPPRWPRAFSH